MKEGSFAHVTAEGGMDPQEERKASPDKYETYCKKKKNPSNAFISFLLVSLKDRGLHDTVLIVRC